jgi:hypothetical protein
MVNGVKRAINFFATRNDFVKQKNVRGTHFRKRKKFVEP